MKSLITLTALVYSLPLQGETLHPEKWYQEKIAAILKGKMEARVPDGRVDVLTETHAIEVEFTSKWKNALGQSLWYALQTGKIAGIVLILEDEKKDMPDAIRLGSVIAAHKLPIKVWLWPRDFKTDESRAGKN
jgi:hypothetical protein